MSRLKLVLLGGLLLTAAGACQREAASRTETENPAVVEAPAEADTAFLPTARRNTWHRLAHRTNPRAPLIRYAAVRRAPMAVAAPPAEARLFDLTLKASEFFRIDPTQPAEVRGREGTVVRLPANALLDERQQPVTEPVWVELKECYSLAELLLSDCVSRSASGEAMQTGGMLLVRASTGRGQVLHLTADQALELELPEEQRRGSRQLYHSADRQRWAALTDSSVPAGSSLAYAQATEPDSNAGTAGSSTAGSLPPAEAEMPRSAEVLRSSALGWLTCLRTARAVTTAPLLVPAEVDEHTTVRLVLPESGVILAGVPREGGFAFEDVPAEQRAVVVGLRYFNGSAYLAVQPVVAGADTLAPLQFEEQTLGDLEQRLEQLR